jgi:undecaprenyl-diphosphatase
VLWLQALHAGAPDAFFRTVTDFGLLAAIFGACLVVAMIRGASWLPAAAALIAVPLTSAITGVAKDAFGRGRPPFSDAAVHPLITLPSDPSFPSGHTSFAFCAAVVVGAYLPRARPALVTLAATVGLSRIWLGVHYPSDVLAGAALGTAVALLVVAGIAGGRRVHPLHPRRSAGAR